MELKQLTEEQKFNEDYYLSDKYENPTVDLKSFNLVF